MIYSPSQYKENRKDLIYKLIRNHSFATIITQSPEGPVVSHLPLLLELSETGATLVGHCAKANSQWKQFADGQTLTAIFHGPHSYISPAWYEPKPDNVPTWNYAAIHVRGHAAILTAEDEVFRVLSKITNHFESDYATGWSLPPAANDEIVGLLRQIVAFRIEIKDIQAKFKLSQKQSSSDRENVISNLSEMNESQQQVAQLMREAVKP